MPIRPSKARREQDPTAPATETRQVPGCVFEDGCLFAAPEIRKQPYDRRPVVEGMDSLLSELDVWRLTRLSRPSRQDAVAAGTFPAPVMVSTRCIAWRRSEIEAWIRSLPRAVWSKPWHSAPFSAEIES